MSTEQNKKIVRRIFQEGIGERKFQVFDELVADKFVNHGIPITSTGPNGMKEAVQQFVNGFSNMQVVNEEFVAEGDMVATRGYMTGTHDGNFMGISATGKKIHLPYIDLWKVKDGKAIENWVQMDIAGLMQQINTKQFAL
jgi:predicted ester cyclase